MVKRLIQLLDECREAHREMDRITAAGRVSQFAANQADEADARLVAAIEGLFCEKLKTLRKEVTELEWRVERILNKLE